MSDRVSQIVLLCEDEVHERFVKEYMKACGLPTHEPLLRSLVASRLEHGGNIETVLNRFATEVRACRQRNTRAKTQLVVMADADDLEVDERRREFDERLRQAGLPPLAPTEPVVLLIPRRHGETWIASLLGRSVSEVDDCKKSTTPTSHDFRRAARTAYEWARPGAVPGPTCVASLRSALEPLRRIG